MTHIPKLQVALDHSDLQGAVRAAVAVGHEVDVIEAGTVCLLQVGSELVEVLRSLFPEKIIVADTKCADAGGTVAKNNAKRGADWMTCICCATIPTMAAALKAIKEERGDRGEIQVELYGDWTYEQAQLWLDAGISQAIYHQSRDALLAGEVWGEKDLNKVKALIDMGFRVSVTGGLDINTLKLFEGVDVFTFIAGRGITEAEDPAAAARAFKDEIRRIGGNNMARPIGIYEKATPKHFTWLERLQFAKALGFDFVEMSVDESDARLARLDWSKQERLDIVKAIYETGVRIPSICFSGHRRYPLGSSNPETEATSLELMKKCIVLAQDLGVRTIQLAGYDVYYEEKSPETRARFIKNLRQACTWAEEAQVILAIEIMDDPFINSIEKYLAVEKEIDSPYLFVYPDTGNVSAWHNDLWSEFYNGHRSIAALHLKDTYAVTETSKGQFRDVPFGQGCVDWEELFDVLKKTHYHGPFLIEMWSENCETVEETRAAIKEAQDFLYPLIEKAGLS
ncbi:L-ribulose-5-phosphate 3-epimerase [Streptococcus equi subsp. zooepidemicus]|nr:L-ribulose-5-phosphate 3-epimerase [Streptococcus equi subsp. zooepidemicus]